MTDLRALTLWPEWAAAIVNLSKRVENRTRRCPPALVGRPVALHAGAAARGRTHEDRWDRMRRVAVRADRPAFLRIVERWDADRTDILSVAPASIVGLIRITACDAPGEGDLSGWRAPDLCGWRFDFAPIAEPIPCKGALGFWRPPQEVMDRLIPQIPEGWR